MGGGRVFGSYEWRVFLMVVILFVEGMRRTKCQRDSVIVYFVSPGGLIMGMTTNQRTTTTLPSKRIIPNVPCVSTFYSLTYIVPLVRLQLHTKKYRMDSLSALKLPKKKSEKKIYMVKVQKREIILVMLEVLFFFAWSLSYLARSFYLTLFVYFSFALSKLRERKDFYKNLLCKQ